GCSVPSSPSGAMGTEPGQCPTAPDGLLVFAGSSPADVEHARIFWNSATLPPPLESSLVQLPSAKDSGSRKSEQSSEKERISEAQDVQKTKVKEKYLQQVRASNPNSFLIDIPVHSLYAIWWNSAVLEMQL
uniref:Cilia- and flagella-associated protein HOATZ n=1 Tax=Anas platyrhynchos TaxID=8839 RepID=A0A8B9T2P2_ANAPL